MGEDTESSSTPQNSYTYSLRCSGYQETMESSRNYSDSPSSYPLSYKYPHYGSTKTTVDTENQLKTGIEKIGELDIEKNFSLDEGN
jgi:hypothetical protein